MVQLQGQNSFIIKHINSVKEFLAIKFQITSFKKYFMKTIIILISFHLSLLLISSCQLKNKSEKEAQNPNIVYILADDLGYAELGSYGQKKIETFNIDKLAGHGITFYSTLFRLSSLCAVQLDIFDEKTKQVMAGGKVFKY